MIKDLIVTDNFFEDTQKILALAKAQNYYPPKSNDSWVGMRSPLLSDVLSKDEMECFYEPISKHVFHLALNGSGEYSFKYGVDLYFHYLDKNIKHCPEFFHRDENLMAGVIYLAKNPTENSGTVVCNNGADTKVRNVFNRGVLYNSNLLHAAQNGFGEVLDDARLTLTIFFTEITLIKRKQKELI